ncbi:MAG: ribosome silencing factor [Pseudomonadota bacterium]
MSAVLCYQQPRRRGRAARFAEDTLLTDHAQAATQTAALDASLGARSAASLHQDHATDHALLTSILSSLEDDKAEQIVSIALAGKSEMADHMVICSGRSSRQVQAIAEKLTDRLKQGHRVLCKVEGQDSGDWVLIDAGDVIVHVFRPEVREFYQLEKMWLTEPRTRPLAEA